MPSWDPESVRRITAHIRSPEGRAAVADAFSKKRKKRTLKAISREVFPILSGLRTNDE